LQFVERIPEMGIEILYIPPEVLFKQIKTSSAIMKNFNFF